MIEKVKRIYRLFFKSTPKFNVKYPTKIERHGTIYGGWNIIPNSLTKDSIIYSVGIGEDISFDLSLINKYDCQIQAFDPTPKVIEWIKSQSLPSQFTFHPIALSSNDGTLTFYTPEKEGNISHTAYSRKSTKAVEVKALTVKSISKMLSHKHIDLLKMDIEGFEYDVLSNMIADGIKPKQLLVEFHHFFPEVGNKKTEDAIAFLEANGYKLFSVADSLYEFSFLLIG